MTRKALCREIQVVNQRLNLRRMKFQLTNEQSKIAFQQLGPYLMIGGGLLAGLVTGAMGWRKIYTFADLGFSFYPLFISTFALDK